MKFVVTERTNDNYRDKKYKNTVKCWSDPIVVTTILCKFTVKTVIIRLHSYKKTDLFFNFFFTNNWTQQKRQLYHFIVPIVYRRWKNTVHHFYFCYLKVYEAGIPHTQKKEPILFGNNMLFFTHACETLVCAPFTDSADGLFPHQCAK